MKNLTDIKIEDPLYGIGEVAYIRASAIRGFLENVIIAGIDFNRGENCWLYSYYMDKIGQRRQQKAPLVLRENEIITQCEALTIQIDFITRHLASAQADLARVIPGQDPPASIVTVYTDDVVKPSAPRFHINSIVYLKESAEVLGRLEKIFVDAIEFDTTESEWKYTFVYKKRPGENMTVEDRIDLKTQVVTSYLESELCTIDEALPLRVEYLTTALSQATTKKEALCGGS